jgi:hypothetical protein
VYFDYQVLFASLFSGSALVVLLLIETLGREDRQAKDNCGAETVED